MTRAEHLDWCKQRALEYVERGALGHAFTSMASDLSKHAETNDDAHAQRTRLGMTLLMSGQLSTIAAMREFILGFN